GRVAADATALGRGSIEAAMPAVRLSDVGGRNGDTPDGIGKTVSRAFLGAVMGAVGNELRGRALEEGKDEAKKALEKLLN
ncbi:MAG TPA: hypothetical protein VFT13_00965, partial [Candidatus Krumholzibacteria bacterium]|nr:hypothetical protein [Candidatus Krumholzibacteria bacterium]